MAWAQTPKPDAIPYLELVELNLDGTVADL
jgi:hypothetical protein